MPNIGKMFKDGNEMHETNQSLETPSAKADPLAADGESFKPSGSTKMEPLNEHADKEMRFTGDHKGDF